MIKHGNRILREQQAKLREELRWAKLSISEQTEEIRQLKALAKDLKAKLSRKSNDVRELIGANRKLRATMNEALEADVFNLALETAYTKKNVALFQGLESSFKEEIRKEVV